MKLKIDGALELDLLEITITKTDVCVDFTRQSTLGEAKEKAQTTAIVKPLEDDLDTIKKISNLLCSANCGIHEEL